MKWIVDRVTIKETKRKTLRMYFQKTMLNPITLTKTITKTIIESSALPVFRKCMRINHRVVPIAMTMTSNIIPARLPSAFVTKKYVINTISVGINKNRKGITNGASRKLVVGRGRNVRSLRRIE